MKALLFVGALIVSAITIVPTVATAATNSDGYLVARVAYADLDLSTSADRVRLDRRINSAIEQVCQRPTTADLRASLAYNKCAVQARASTKKSVALALNGLSNKARKA